MNTTVAEIANCQDLWKFAVGLVRGGEVSEPAVLRARLVEACESIPADDRPDAAELSKMVRKALEAESKSADPVPVKPAGNSFPGKSEAALAEYLAMSKLNTLLRRDHARGAWCEWSGTHWQSSTDVVPLKLQAAVRRAIADGIEGRTIEARDAPRLESASGMRGISTLLSAFPSVWLVGEGGEIDPPNLIACPRGVLDLKTGEWLAHDSKRPITKHCPVDPGPSCELWAMIEDHLKACLGAATYPAFHRFLGSALAGRPADRRLLWLWGRQGNDGKSTLVRVLRAALGDHLAVIPAEVFGEGARGANGHELSSGLASCRLAVALEVGDQLNWHYLKTLSGGDEQTTKRLHGRKYGITRPPHLLLVANEPARPPDNPIAERVILAELMPPDEIDERLAKVLGDGGPERAVLAAACLSWLIAGCAEFQEHGLGPVPLCGHKPTGLDAWWAELIGNGTIVPGRGWAHLSEIRPLLTEAVQGLHNREIAQFLRTRVVCNRHKTEGVRYAIAVQVKDDEG